MRRSRVALLLGVVDPADELVACQGSDVDPGGERRGAGDERLPEIRRKLVDHSTGHVFAAHGITVLASQSPVQQVDTSAASVQNREAAVPSSATKRSQQSVVNSSAMVSESEVSAQ